MTRYQDWTFHRRVDQRWLLPIRQILQLRGGQPWTRFVRWRLPRGLDTGRETKVEEMTT